MSSAPWLAKSCLAPGCLLLSLKPQTWVKTNWCEAQSPSLVLPVGVLWLLTQGCREVHFFGIIRHPGQRHTSLGEETALSRMVSAFSAVVYLPN